MTVFLRHRLEAAYRKRATPFPCRRPRTAWALVGSGVIAGIAVAQLQRLAVQPLPGAGPAETTHCPPSAFELDPLPADLEPRLTAQQWAELQQNLGPQQPKPPAPPSLPEQQSEPSC